MSERERWRSLLGRTTVLWAGADGFREREAGWVAFSGVPSVEFNVALCDRTTDGAAGLQAILDEVLASQLPTLLFLAGTGLGDAQTLVDAGWICLDSLPLMVRPIGTTGATDPAVVALGLDDATAVRSLVEQAFLHSPELAAVAVPDNAFTAAGQTVWGLFDEGELVSCFATVRTDEASGWWSLATPPHLQGRGYGGRLFRGVLAEEAKAGVQVTLAWCTPAGRRATMSVGFEEVERWQLWSRPRWVLGRR